MAKKIVCPFKVGDRVVVCPGKSNHLMRGCTGTVVSITNNLKVSVAVDPHQASWGVLNPEEQNVTFATYNLQSPSKCHECAYRLKKLVGGRCPHMIKEVKETNEQTRNEDGV